MRPGKFSESVLKRSILKQIKTKREEVIRGAGVGEDCAFFSFQKEEGVLLSTTPVIAEKMEDVGFGITAAVNNIAAGGGEPTGLLMSWILPDKILESAVQGLSGEIERVCRRLNLQTAGGDTRITTAVKTPVLNVTVIGKKEKLLHQEFYQYKPGQEIILTKWAGMAGTAILAAKEEEKLKKRLPLYLIENGISLKEQISVLSESAIAMKVGTAGMHDVSRGGIFAALWELAERGNTGIEVDLKKIPIRQETIEICEVLGVNPYELYGAGALLIVTEKGSQLVSELKKAQIPACCIGKITEGSGKVIINDEEVRFLDRPKNDAIKPWLCEGETKE